MITNLKDYKNYKQALKILPQLEIILRILTLTEKGLTPFVHYIPVARVLATIRDQRQLLDTYRNMYQKIKDEKGSKNDIKKI